jgi:hypothetical protein
VVEKYKSAGDGRFLLIGECIATSIARVVLLSLFVNCLFRS